jgi:alpha,alpha-trehalase
VYRYAVTNSAPRPESYFTGMSVTILQRDTYRITTIDYLTAHDPDVGPLLDEKRRADLYAELASGAETGALAVLRCCQGFLTQLLLGWDYTARWFKDISIGLKSLAVRDTVPICLNSILCLLVFSTVLRMPYILCYVDRQRPSTSC